MWEAFQDGTDTSSALLAESIQVSHIEPLDLGDIGSSIPAHEEIVDTCRDLETDIATFNSSTVAAYSLPLHDYTQIPSFATGQHDMDITSRNANIHNSSFAIGSDRNSELTIGSTTHNNAGLLDNSTFVESMETMTMIPNYEKL